MNLYVIFLAELWSYIKSEQHKLWIPFFLHHSWKPFYLTSAKHDNSNLNLKPVSAQPVDCYQICKTCHYFMNAARSITVYWTWPIEFLLRAKLGPNDDAISPSVLGLLTPEEISIFRCSVPHSIGIDILCPYFKYKKDYCYDYTMTITYFDLDRSINWLTDWSRRC